MKISHFRELDTVTCARVHRAGWKIDQFSYAERFVEVNELN